MKKKHEFLAIMEKDYGKGKFYDNCPNCPKGREGLIHKSYKFCPKCGIKIQRKDGKFDTFVNLIQYI